MSQSYKKMVVSDLDGTLIGVGKQASAYSNIWENLALHKILRVIATGRNLFSLYKVLPMDFPIDYLAFSSGAGILHWPSKKLLYSSSIATPKLDKLIVYLQRQNIDFMIQQEVPKNHYFFYYKNKENNVDFCNRLALYKNFATLISAKTIPKKSCQIIAIIPSHQGLTVFKQLSQKLRDFQVIRTTSPLDGTSMWIEIFAKGICKSFAANWLANKFAIDKKNTLAIGNDYNDLDLLEWAENSFVVENAPSDLKSAFAIADFPSAISDFL